MDDIIVSNITKDYGDNRGIFNISFNIKKGEMFGYVGTNGSGKTTTIRHIMGFSKLDNGSITVKGLDAYKDSPDVKKYIGYVPGEISFPDLSSGTEVLKSQAELIGLTNMNFANELISRLQLDVRANPRRMSKGMKQKLAIVLALMNDPEILILDEPTTGLDPLMRTVFIDIIKEEKKKGKTIMMSSHLFEELESTADRVALIMDGKLVDIVDINSIRNRKYKDYKIEFNDEKEYAEFLKTKYKVIRKQPNYNQITLEILESDTQQLLNDLKKYNLKFFSEVKYNLEKSFKEKLAELRSDKQ